MNTRQRYLRKAVACVVTYSLIFGQVVQSAQAASTDISDVPMVVKTSVKPNVLVIMDNSESMDATMSGQVIAGDDPTTRGNIGRNVMRNTITTYRTNFNWGLMSFGMSHNPPDMYNTYAYYLGSNTGMVFTDDCVSGVSASNGGRRCVANPQPFTGGNFVTYDQSGDDASIQDVLYTGSVYSSLWGLSSSGTDYDIYLSHRTSSGNSWASSAFSSSQGTWSFTPTDAGFLANNPPTTRQLYLPRAWGYLSSITGSGTINVPAQADSTSQYNNLMAKLAAETSSNTSEIKNGALFTPIKGTLDSARTYFSSSYQSNTSPIAYSCQKNFVMMVTDGLPTGNTSGNLYSTAARTNTYNAATGTWTFGQAAQDAISSVAALRSTTKGSTAYDIQTYVIALGDTVANANAIAVMNAMATAGGTNANDALGNSAYLASNSATFQAAIDAVTANIISKTSAAAAVAASNPTVVVGDNTSYTTSYNSATWSGELQAFPIDLTTGQINSSAPIWSSSAQAQLDARTAADRFIATYTGTAGASQGIQFQPTTASTATKLSTAQQTSLNSTTTPPGPSDGAAVLAYLRGDRSGETAGTYRSRAHLLGDIIHAEPLVIRTPFANYSDTDYSTFKANNAGRTKIVLQAANDGMLHAFDAATGAERWAYVPNLLLGNLDYLTSRNSFAHRNFIDGTPVTSDVDFDNTGGAVGTPDWRTIVVGGLGKGGRGYYALDVTSTTAADEAAVAGKVLWEFPNSATTATVKANVGYSFGKPIIAKTAAQGWVVLVTSGYNNGTNTGDSGGDGKGYLFVLNAKTGAVISAIGTDVGSTSTPSGLAQISGYVVSGDTDNTVQYVYGGDLNGNVWRFDLTGNNINQWQVRKLATLVDASGNSQPVTAEPELANVRVTGGAYKRFVYVGTGRYLGDTDIPGATGANANASQTQTMYGLVDDLSDPGSSGTVITPLRSNLQQQTLTVNGDGSRTASSINVNFSVKKGWYVDMPGTGERIDTSPGLAYGVLAFTSNLPNTDPCVPGGTSFLNVLDYQTGAYAAGATSNQSSIPLGSALSSRPVLVQLPSGRVVGLIQKSDATIATVTVVGNPGSTFTLRKSWIELMQ